MLIGQLRSTFRSLFTLTALAFLLQAPVAAAGDLKVLRVLLPPVEDAQAARFNFRPMSDFLEQVVGIRIEADVATSYTQAVHALETKRTDVAFLGPFSYVMAHEKTGGKVEPLVSGVSESTGKSTYNSVIVARSSLRIRHPRQFGTKHTLAFSDPASTSGYLVPMWELGNQGIDPKKSLAGTRFTGSHTATLTAVNFGEVDGGGSNIRSFEALLKQGLINPHHVKIVWKSPDLPGEPVTIRSDLPDQIKYRLLKAFMGFPRGQAHFDPAISHYEPAFDEQYDLIRQVRKELGDRI